MRRYLFFGEKKSHSMDPLIRVVLDEMKTKGVYSDDYPRLLAYLERLNQAKIAEEDSHRNPINWDRVIAVGGNILVVLTIIVYEQNHPILSNGWRFVGRPRTEQ